MGEILLALDGCRRTQMDDCGAGWWRSAVELKLRHILIRRAMPLPARWARVILGQHSFSLPASIVAIVIGTTLINMAIMIMVFIVIVSLLPPASRRYCNFFGGPLRAPFFSFLSFSSTSTFPKPLASPRKVDPRPSPIKLAPPSVPVGQTNTWVSEVCPSSASKKPSGVFGRWDFLAATHHSIDREASDLSWTPKTPQSVLQDT